MKARSSTATVGTATRRGISPRQQPAVKLNSILVPYDFSAPSKQALQTALALVREFGGSVTLQYVIEPLVFGDFDANPLVMENDATKAKAKEKLVTVQMHADGTGDLIKSVKVSTGKPFKEICAFARRFDYDLIVIATHGRTGLKHVLLGSTAEKVVRHAPCPVFVVRGKQSHLKRESV